MNKLPSNLRPTTRECVHLLTYTVSGTDMTRGISRRYVYMQPLEDAMRALSGPVVLL